MRNEDDFTPRRPHGQVERAGGTPVGPRSASYATLVPRVRRRLPSAPTDRRASARSDGDSWRGRLVDLRR